MSLLVQNIPYSCGRLNAQAVGRKCAATRTTSMRCGAHRRSAQIAMTSAESVAMSAFTMFVACAPAGAEEYIDFGKGGNADPKSYFTVLALFLISLPGLWSQVKRAPKAKIKRKTFETPGPEAEDGMAMDSRARQLYSYMKSYNYEVKSTGEVITFEGNYRSTRGQAAAITFYMFVGMLSTGLVLSIAAPGGNLWYLLVLLTPLAPWYYYQNADRKEEFSIKMIASDDDKTIDIVVQGDDEEIERMTKALQLKEKGMVYVPGILERQQ